MIKVGSIVQVKDDHCDINGAIGIVYEITQEIPGDVDGELLYMVTCPPGMMMIEDELLYLGDFYFHQLKLLEEAK